MLRTLDKHSLSVYAGVTLLSTFMSIAAISMYYWLHIDGTTDMGMFNSSNEGAKGYTAKCTSEMSELECGYFHSMRVSSVLTILFGGVTAFLYVFPPRAFGTFPTFIAVTGNLFQMIFAIMTCVIFLYFKRNYYNDDGVNREFESPSSSSLSIGAAYWLWVAATILLFPIVTGGYYHLYVEHNRAKKSLLP